MNKQTGGLEYGYAKHMRDALRNASFIAFTGTPVSADDRDTRGVFGDYIDVYDMEQAQQDQATVPIDGRGVAAGATEALPDGFGPCVGSRVERDRAVMVAPSPAMAYTDPDCVPTKTMPFATVTQQSAFASMS